MRRWTGVALDILVVFCPSLYALNPALNVSQYGHTAWRVRDGVLKAAPHSVAQTPDGYLWLATDLGLFRFDGVRATPWSAPEGGRQNLWGDATSNVRLAPPARDVEVDYTALDLAAPEESRFKVKLEGKDQDWQEVGARKQAFYSDLPPSHYRFHVAASHNNGPWNEAGVPFRFLRFSSVLSDILIPNGLRDRLVIPYEL